MPTVSTGMRYPALDGLRGVAAVVVVVSHFMLLFSAYADATYGGNAIKTGTLEWALTYTPLHLFWAGTEVVYVFFILSGIVLALPILKPGEFSWLAYYPSRLIRLYGPVVVGVALAAMTIWIIPRETSPLLGAWINSHPSEYGVSSFFRDSVLVTGTSGVVGPLWSLRWEVLFSLLLPAYVVFSVYFKKLTWVKVGLLILLIAMGSLRANSYLMFLPMFGIGVLIASQWSRLSLWASRSALQRWAWPVILMVGIVLMCVRWELVGLGVDEASAGRFQWVAALGAGTIVMGVAFWERAITFFSSRSALWLGKISFSLYLVHEPVIVATRQATADVSPWIAIALSIPIALLVTLVFSRFVEQPFHRLARATSRAISKKSRSDAQGQAKVHPSTS